MLFRSEDIQTEDFESLSKLMSVICESLRSINDSADGDQDAEEKTDLAELKKQLPSMKREVARLTEAVERRVKNPAAPRTDRAKRTAKGKSRKGRPASLKMYVIEARIADIEPPIFRKLAVPGNRTLADLHVILQDAFGWSDTHLHAFVVRGEEYGVPSLDEDRKSVV